MVVPYFDARRIEEQYESAFRFTPCSTASPVQEAVKMAADVSSFGAFLVVFRLFSEYMEEAAIERARTETRNKPNFREVRFFFHIKSPYDGPS